MTVHHVFDIGQYQTQVRARNSAGVAPWSAAVDYPLAMALGWQNPRDRFDVNRDNSITPRDALRVINVLNAGLHSEPGTGRLPPARPLDVESAYSSTFLVTAC